MPFAGWEEGGPATKCCRHGGAWKESGKYANCQLKVWKKDEEDFTTFLKYGEQCKWSIQGLLRIVKMLTPFSFKLIWSNF